MYLHGCESLEFTYSFACVISLLLFQNGVTAYDVAKLSGHQAVCDELEHCMNQETKTEITLVSVAIATCLLYSACGYYVLVFHYQHQTTWKEPRRCARIIKWLIFAIIIVHI